jgi:hypothetical protein
MKAVAVAAFQEAVCPLNKLRRDGDIVLLQEHDGSVKALISIRRVMRHDKIT